MQAGHTDLRLVVSAANSFSRPGARRPATFRYSRWSALDCPCRRWQKLCARW